jgi:hypothetical protein
MKHMQIVDIKNALTTLGKERLPIAYEIAKNIRMCSNVIQETADLSKELFEKFADKDDQGQLINYPVEVPEGQPEQTQMRISDPAKLKSYQVELIKVLDADHTIDFVKIPRSKIQSEKLEASILLPLIDIVIE